MPEFNETLLDFEYLYGLIGYPLSHSFSKRYFAQKFEKEGITNAFYELFPLEQIGELDTLLANYPNLRGLNVTIPYKEQVLPFLDEMDESAAAIGAVNAIKIANGKRIGYNTDAYGFEITLRQALLQHPFQVAEALVLGTGGAAKAVIFVLRKLNIGYKTVSRAAGKADLTYEALNPAIMKSNLLVINTTPLGMHPGIETFPNIPYHCLCNEHLLYDLVYNPEKTLFLQKGEARQAQMINGLPMLYAQAARAWAIWNAIAD